LLVGAVVAVTTALVVAANPIERLEEFTELPQVTATDRGYVTEHLLSASGNGRWQYWEVAVGQFREAPLRGAGAGSFHEAWEQKRPISSYVLDAHSLYVEALGELGVVGLGMIAGLVILAGAVIVQTSRRAQESQRPTIASLSAVVLGFGVALGVDWMWELTAVAVVGVAVLTLLACLSPNGGRSWSVPIRWRLAAVAAAVMAIAVAVIPLLASTRLEASQAAVRRGATDEALSEARAARDLQPWAAAPYLQLALIEEQSGRLRAARAWLSEAQERDPRNAALWLIAARLHTKSGLLQAARSDLARARRLNPFLRLPS
jgi:O-antigen ligase